MMSDVELVQGDTRPAVEGTLRVTRTGDILDLTNAESIKFQLRKADDELYTVDGEAIFVNRTAGRVRYEWDDGDLNNPGEYLAQWEIVWDDDTVQTTNPANTIEIRRQ